ncbi:helix-turn-helix domain-containing protein [Alicyclobacillus fastidiosus]|uniref:helix-turn-helix domain-containing protein n=1 Tax=Alicyclobacillus fastidiosus TaxID=392011 RepID=UPI0024E0C0F9|nr:helix-turn-helix transcriptional regulator [Alicyclobacillus fastidiosus]
MRVKDNPATRLRVLMAERDINTLELSQLTGVSQQAISALRSGRVKSPKIETARLIAKALGVRTSDIWENR